MRPASLKPLAAKQPSAQAPTTTAGAPDSAGSPLAAASYYSVFWTRDPQQKKHKVYEDGILSMDGKVATLFDLDGKQVARSMMKLSAMATGETLELARISLEVTHTVAAETFTSGDCFLTGCGAAGAAGGPFVPKAGASGGGPGVKQLGGLSSGFKPPTVVKAGLMPTKGVAAALASSSSSSSSQAGLGGDDGGSSALPLGHVGASSGASAAAGGAATAAPKASIGFGRWGAKASSSSSSLLGSGLLGRSGGGASGGQGSTCHGGLRARHDPAAPDALVLHWPPGWPGAPPGVPPRSSSSGGSGGGGGGLPPGTAPVVVDPVLTRCLREHQREGVQFLFDAVTGRRSDAGTGCILADDMGLGKSLMVIALTWTLLKQSPGGATAPATISKAVIVCPSSLVGNWRQEFKKWLGNERLEPLAVNVQGKDAREKVREFVFGKAPVLIISYEMLRKHADVLSGASSGGESSSSSSSSSPPSRIGLLVCDEGHRLKSSGGNKTIAALESLPTRRRVLLTGTPLQNNLSELFALCNFVCPGALGTLQAFKLTFQGPIERGRDKSATPAQAALASERSKALAVKLGRFVLRRTAGILERYLPPKTESLVFARLAPLQTALYRAVVASKTARTMALRGDSGGGSGGGGQDAGVLVVLNALRQICAHPDLVHPDGKVGGEAGAKGGSGGAHKRKKAAGGSSFLAGASVGIAKRARPSASSSCGGDNDDDEGSGSRSAAGSPAVPSSSGGQRGSSGTVAVIKRSIGVIDSEAEEEGAGEGSDSEGSLREFIEHDEDEEEGSDAVAGSDDEASAVAAPSSSSYDARLAALPASAALAEDIRHVFPPGYVPGVLAGAAAGTDISTALHASSKLRLLDRLLAEIRRCSSPHIGGGSSGSSAASAAPPSSSSSSSSSDGGGGGPSSSSSSSGSPDRVVIVSNYGQVLNLVEGLCAARGYAYARLDGCTPADKRQGLVNDFNAQGSPTYAFLLSAQAGGAGLNLIGANRLIMLDSSWNPAIDKQALARVWRDGQRKHTYIYRLVSAHCLEEKVLQRQALKEAMASALGQAGGKDGVSGRDGGSGGARFSQDELRALFALDPGQGVFGTCDTAGVMNKAYTQATLTSSGTVDAAGDAAAAAAARRLHWPAYAGPGTLGDAVLRGAATASSSSSSAAQAAAAPSVVYVRTVLINQPSSSGAPDDEEEHAPASGPLGAAPPSSGAAPPSSALQPSIEQRLEAALAQMDPPLTPSSELSDDEGEAEWDGQ